MEMRTEEEYQRLKGIEGLAQEVKRRFLEGVAGSGCTKAVQDLCDALPDEETPDDK